MTDGDELARAEALLDLGRHHESETMLRTLLASEPDSAGALRLLALALGAQGRFEEAERAVARATELVPDDPWVHIEASQALLALGRPEKAYTRAMHATRLSPALWAAHYAVARSLRAQRDSSWTDAWEAVGEALRLAPHESSAHNMAGILLLDVQDTGRAREAFERALELDPRNTTAMSNLADLEAASGRLKRATRALAGGLAISPASENLHDSYAFLLAVILRRLWIVGLVAAAVLLVFGLAHVPYALRSGVTAVLFGGAGVFAWRQVRALPGGRRAWRHVLQLRVGEKATLWLLGLVVIWSLAAGLGLTTRDVSAVLGELVLVSLRALGVVVVVGWIIKLAQRD